jgi:hypothetical protein
MTKAYETLLVTRPYPQLKTLDDNGASGRTRTDKGPGSKPGSCTNSHYLQTHYTTFKLVPETGLEPIYDARSGRPLYQFAYPEILMRNMNGFEPPRP